MREKASSPAVQHGQAGAAPVLPCWLHSSVLVSNSCASLGAGIHSPASKGISCFLAGLAGKPQVLSMLLGEITVRGLSVLSQ